MRLPAGILLICVTANSPVVAAPACFGAVEIANVRVVRAEDNGVLVLEDGRAIKLEGIRLPKGSTALRDLAVGRQFNFHATAPKQDRYDRVRAQAVFADGEWLQEKLLDQGLARVEMAPDRPQCAAEFYALEGAARNARLGLWSDPANAVRGVFLKKADTGTFQIIEGKVLSVDIRNGRAYLNFGTDYKTDFTVTISQEDRAVFRAAKVDPRNYLGKTIRVRGILQFYNGPELEVAAPHQIEIVR